MALPATLAPTTWRPEIQALRALAVVAVVTFHSWPGLAPGGQVGVDVFFVVSGFLITSMLVRERENTRRISFGGFALKRARRLLPSALIVLVACTAASVTIMPEQFRAQLFREIAASALLVQNWNLNIAARIPGAEPLENSPLRHFWTLSVEEQFYLVWPALIAVVLTLAARRSNPRIALAVTLGVVTVASFTWSIVLTGYDHSQAYFSTTARAWEFALGGLLALAPFSGRFLSLASRAVLSWVGLGAVTVSIFAGSDENLFPGWIVLAPVLGTAAVIWAGSPAVRWGTAALAQATPVQWLGGVSYALYLWHWPIIVFTPYLTGQPSPWWLMAALIALSVLLAWVTTRFVEAPIRALRMPRRPVSRDLAPVTD